MSLTVKSPTIVEGHAIPVAHTEDGEDLSVRRSRWSPRPLELIDRQIALLVDAPDADGSRERRVRWTRCSTFPSNLSGRPAGFAIDGFQRPRDAAEGLRSRRTNAWGYGSVTECLRPGAAASTAPIEGRALRYRLHALGPGEILAASGRPGRPLLGASIARSRIAGGLMSHVSQGSTAADRGRERSVPLRC